MDVTGYPDAAIANGIHGFAFRRNLMEPKLRQRQERDGNCYRFRLPLDLFQWRKINLGGGPVHVEPKILRAVGVDGQVFGSELVRINDAFKSRKYRYRL